MLWDSYLEVHTPRGVFELVLRDSPWSSRSPARRVATPEETERAWFFLECDLEDPIWSELQPVLDLHAELTGERIVLTDTPRDVALIQQVREELQRALWNGELQFEEVPQPLPLSHHIEYVTLPEPGPKGPASGKEPKPIFLFEAFLVDEVDEPLEGIEVTFSWTGKQEHRTTSGTGLASCEVPEGANARLEIVSRAALDEALKSHWNKVRNKPRSQWVKPHLRATVVEYQSSRPHPPVTVKPEVVHTVSYQPYVVLAQLFGAYFDTNKCFLLPTVIPRIQRIKELYDQHPESTLLIVGHTDVTGEPDTNDPLSLERAESMAAYLTDKVEAWLAWYDADEPSKRWGAGEDKLMIRSLPNYRTKPATEDRIRWFQRTRGLQNDGIAGTETRTRLIREYMGHDGTTLPEGIELVTHGCGENFPASTEEARKAAWARHSTIHDRRVELFFFDKTFGVQPEPTGQNSAAGSPRYPDWVRRVAVTHELRAEGVAKELTLLEMHDALFRTDSAVVLPEGEDPTRDREGHLSLTTVGLVATVLRYNEEHPGKKLLVAGHCDTKGDIAYNQPLSEERAQASLALLRGDREAFKELCEARHDGVDLTQIFDWASRALLFDCQPTRTDAAPSDTTIRRFQTAYNEWLDAGEAEGKTHGPEKLDVDGDVGLLTWGAIYDCYESVLRQELGEDAAGVAGLRGKLVWLDSGQPWRGYSEHFPMDNLGRDEYRSQANRRVEVLFFDDGEEPDLSLEEGNPEMSDVYLTGKYEREHLDPMLSALPWKAEWDRKEEPTKADERRQMILEAPGLPAGTPVTYTVFLWIAGAFHAAFPIVSGLSSTDRASRLFDTWFDAEQATYRGELAAGEEFAKAEYLFVAESGGRRKESALLAYADFVDVTFVHKSTKVPAADVPCVVHTAWGSKGLRTDEDGRVRVEGLPPGGADVAIGDHYLQHDPPAPGTGGTAPGPETTRELKLKLLDHDFSPRAEVPYRIVTEFPEAWEGVTDSNGMVTVDLPVSVSSVELILEEGSFEIDIADIPSVEEVAGAQRRLTNLGYDAGDPTGTVSDQTKQAVLKFRNDHGLGDPGAGEPLDPATRTKLAEIHGH